MPSRPNKFRCSRPPGRASRSSSRRSSRPVSSEWPPKVCGRTTLGRFFAAGRSNYVHRLLATILLMVVIGIVAGLGAVALVAIAIFAFGISAAGGLSVGTGTLVVVGGLVLRYLLVLVAITLLLSGVLGGVPVAAATIAVQSGPSAFEVPISETAAYAVVHGGGTISTVVFGAFNNTILVAFYDAYAPALP